MGTRTESNIVMSKANRSRSADSDPEEPGEVFRNSLNALPMAVAALSGDGTILAINDAWENWVQPFSGEAISTDVGSSFLDACETAAALGNQSAARIAHSLHIAVAGSPIETTIEYNVADGGEIRRFRTMVKSSGNVIVVTHLDISESMAGRERISFQSSLLNAVGQSVVAVDIDGRVTFWNEASENMLGWKSDEALGRHFIDLGIIDDSDDALAIVARVKSGKCWSGEHWTQHKSGRRFCVYSTITPLFDDGEVVAIIDVSTDTSELRRAEAEAERLSALVESSNDAINGATLDGTITSWNLGAERLYGYSAEEAVGSSVAMLSPQEDNGADVKLRQRLRAGDSVVGHEVRGLRKDGTILDVALTFSPVYDAYQNLVGSSAIARDITEIKRLRATAELERDRLTVAQEVAHVGSVEVDMVSGQRWWSDEYFRIHGLPVGTVATEELWLSLIHPEDSGRVALMWQALEGGGPPLEIIHRIVRPNQEVRWVHIRATAERDDNGRLLKLVETAVDITDRKRAEEALEKLAFTDPLTGLANRARLTECIEVALVEAEVNGGQVGILFLDVDRFKVINDAMGHSAGDDLLKQIADRLRGAVRPSDTLARFAGDEFVIVCGQISEAGARKLADRIQSAVRAPFTLDDREVFANLSVGIAMSSEEDTAESLLHNADTAMYRCKESVLDEPLVFKERMHQRGMTRLDVESQLPRAVERGELRVHYQPILDVKSLRPVGMEALLRWQHPAYGLLAPAEFIPIAEETGQIVPIGAWVLAEALQQAQRWRTELATAKDWRISINLSARQLQDPALVDTVRDAIANAGIDASAVELEITESVLMKDADHSLGALIRLRELGVGLSIDDFGTGYSSLGYLKRFPVTSLKIDRSFIDGLNGSDVHADSIVEAITGLASALHLDFVAEGVETDEQLKEVSRLDARLAQGYLWAKPLPPCQIPGWLAEHPA